MFLRFRTLVITAGVTVLMTNLTQAQEDTIYDEQKVPAYTLPDPLVFADGQPVKSARQWLDGRRGEILELFAVQMYGKTPVKDVPVHYELLREDPQALDGAATCRQVAIHVGQGESQQTLVLALWIPNASPKPVPAFVGLNFHGNHTLTNDSLILLPESWVRNSREEGITDNRAVEQSRGSASGRWPLSLIIQRGYALGTMYYGDIDPDYDDQFQNGIHPLFYDEGETRPKADEWGSIGAWAWGLSRILDYLSTVDEIDASRVAVMGHSRLGKTALWAGAQDPRFALVISNNSGCGGATLSRRRYGETVARINTSFPHWFADNFEKYNNRENELPIDQHQLLALIAPRPVLVCSAEEDRWADPRGEFLSAFHASPVYELLGEQGIPSPQMPPVHQLVGGTIAYHIRPGAHDVKLEDWEVYLEFADRHLGATPE
jgi:hypothetical protein